MLETILQRSFYQSPPQFTPESSDRHFFNTLCVLKSDVVLETDGLSSENVHVRRTLLTYSSKGICSL